ncbi:CBS domain-containing protein [Paenibacillus sp. UNCCL117]|uniref:DUF294 nucleotidyltransferase-like domain-containing protein n=1 Tax=unclassified Paenibacillus TaxID=185978 RepID=UPI00087EEF04|nr:MULTISPECIES: DUF294 nucleotidyltransferase-like domain-containing protein [unclassified Paenibacillus]SDC22553.1 CBS domain-containing protein [Paenibacillus sp. cl123]SFW19066.1 CBS domain-containing protein [Paenibacillus sp. UNCCL117]
MGRQAWASMIQEAIEARDVQQLKELRDRAHTKFLQHLPSDPPFVWNEEVNRFHDLIIGRVIAMTEHDVCEERGEEVPLAYAFLLFGSGGRAEQTLWSDQDNGLVYEDTADEALKVKAAAFFRELAERISINLERAGYPPCSGGVLCANPKWTQPLAGYRQMLDAWLAEPDWEHVRYLLIVADLRVIHGDHALGDQLTERLVAYMQLHPAMYGHMQRNTLHHKASIGIFGQLIKERYGVDAGGVDVKYGAYIPIVNGVRLLALEAGIRVTSTESRIRLLIAGRHVPDDIGHDWLDALSTALKLRSTTPYQMEEGTYSSRGMLTPEQLTRERTIELKLCLRIAGELQKFVKKTVHYELEMKGKGRENQ